MKVYIYYGDLTEEAKDRLEEQGVSGITDEDIVGEIELEDEIEIHEDEVLFDDLDGDSITEESEDDNEL